MLLGTRWGDEDAKLIPAPGDPYYLKYAYDPLMVGIDSAAGRGRCPRPRSRRVSRVSPMSGPVLPMVPPPPQSPVRPAPVLQQSQIFAGPYGAEASTPPPAPASAAPPEPTAPTPGGGG